MNGNGLYFSVEPENSTPPTLGKAKSHPNGTDCLNHTHQPFSSCLYCVLDHMRLCL